MAGKIFTRFILSFTKKEKVVLFKGDMQKMDSLIKCFCARMQNIACIGAFNLMHILFLKITKSQSSISASIFPEQRHEYSFLFWKKSAHFYYSQNIDTNIFEKHKHNIICSKGLFQTLITALQLPFSKPITRGCLQCKLKPVWDLTDGFKINTAQKIDTWKKVSIDHF